MADIFTAAFWNQYGALLWKEFLHTMVMTGVSTFFAYLIGLPLGVLLVLTADHGIRPHRILNQVVGWIINVGRSLPFIILMISIMDFTKLVVGTKIGVKGAIVPLVVSAAPFIAQLSDSLPQLVKNISRGSAPRASATLSRARHCRRCGRRRSGRPCHPLRLQPPGGLYAAGHHRHSGAAGPDHSIRFQPLVNKYRQTIEIN